MNINLLKSKLVLHNYSYKEISNKLEISESALSQKVNGKIKFSLEDVKVLRKLLDLNESETIDIFLT